MRNGAPAIADGDSAAGLALGAGELVPAVKARLVDYLGEHYSKPISVAHLAQMVGLTRSHFSERFSRSFGLPPHQYVLHLRLDWATELLAHSELRIADVAALTGFSSQSHLSSAFRRHRGTTPRQIRIGAA